LIAISGVTNSGRGGIAVETKQVIISLAAIDGRGYFGASRMINTFLSALRK